MSEGTYLDDKAYLLSLKPSLRLPPELVRQVVGIFEANGTRFRAIQETPLAKATVRSIYTHWAAGRLARFTPQGQRPHQWRRTDSILRDQRERQPEQAIDLQAFASTRAIGMKLLREVCFFWEKGGALTFVKHNRVKFLQCS